MSEAILVLNAGSSSLKFAVYGGASGALVPVLRGKVAGIGTAAVFSARDGVGAAVPEADLLQIAPEIGHDALIPLLLAWIAGNGVRITSAGHRVVHGGRAHAGPAKVSADLLEELEALVPLAPLHQPHNLDAIRSVAAFAPELPQVACFDTSFHRTQDRLAQLFALPREMSEAGILRYGFHGLSYDYIAGRLPEALGARAEGRVIVAHLGNGASMCAMRGRQSVATSMGFTALDGLMMGQRCGALDPGVVLYLMQQKGMSAEAVGHVLYEKSGLAGVSGMTNDMTVLQASDSAEAREAIALFCYRAAGELAQLVAAIDGLDAIVFTAGIGENSAEVRAMICDRLGWLGVTLDMQANAANATRISAAGSAVAVLVIPTDEEAVIAAATHRLGTDLG
ncbi:acetate/propionate family kinase [Pseudooceanicola spongiae]|uniref:Acetate kinase n=1 Tax=Pseudooceanicola spongiae TaxID=2613965 RepID=A0A7L9WQL0_9RHOB|nr:acetate/propionate family kinase [Pseudooceanicola spongiae]QOL82134.1 acetate/propionate family kinase [Pseudooceanicola spongiae]